MHNGFWYTYDDAGPGGSSLVTPEPGKPFIMAKPGHDGSGEFACMKGKVTTQYQYGFIGMGYYLSPSDVRKPFNLRDKSGIRFWHRGDNKKYRVKLVSVHPDFSAGDGDNQFGYDFHTDREWAQVEIRFCDLSQQPGWGSRVDMKDALAAIKEIQFCTLGQPHESVELCVDGIEFF